MHIHRITFELTSTTILCTWGNTWVAFFNDNIFTYFV